MNCQSLLHDGQCGPHVPMWAPGTCELILGVSLCGRVSQEEAAEMRVRTDCTATTAGFPAAELPSGTPAWTRFPEEALSLLSWPHIT